MHVMGIDGSPRGHGTTRLAVASALESAATTDDGVTTAIYGVADYQQGRIVDAMMGANALVIGTPMYRAAPAAPVKDLLDAIPRGEYGDDREPLRGLPIMIVGTAQTWAHYLGMECLRTVLSNFFAAWVVPPGTYLVSKDHVGESGLSSEAVSLLQQQAEVLVRFSEAASRGAWAGAVRPQI